MPDDGDRAQQINERLQQDLLAAHFRNTQGREAPSRSHHAAPAPLSGGGEVICIDCDEPIPPRRLEVKPDAIRCVDCQSDFETLSRGVK